MNYLAFDLGASSGKLFLGRYDGSKLSLETVLRFDNGPIALGDSLYWDFLGIYSNMCKGIQRAFQLAHGTVACFGVDSFSNDFSFIDRSGGLLSPMHCYRDSRTARCEKAIFQKMDPMQLYMSSGNQIALFNTLMHLSAMREEKRDNVLLDSSNKMLFLPDLLCYYLTGEAVSEYTISSVSQMFDFGTRGWNEHILNTFDIPTNILCPIVEPGTILGKTKKSFRSEFAVPDFEIISVCEHDTASAFLSSLHNGPSAIISSGTWALVGVEVHTPIINDFGYHYNIANEGGYPNHHRLLRNVMGSWLLQELKSSYSLQGIEYSFSDLEVLAQQEKPFRWLIDVDAKEFFTPGNIQEKVRQACTSLDGTKPETPGQFVRCICESLALKYRWSIEKIEQLINRSLPVVSMVGGGSKDALTCQFTANACGKPVTAGPADASAIGNILVQMLCKGEISSISQGKELLRSSFSCREYQPQDTIAWDTTYKFFLDNFHLDKM